MEAMILGFRVRGFGFRVLTQEAMEHLGREQLSCRRIVSPMSITCQAYAQNPLFVVSGSGLIIGDCPRVPRKRPHTSTPKLTTVYPKTPRAFDSYHEPSARNAKP